MNSSVCEEPSSSQVTLEIWSLQDNSVNGAILAAFGILYFVVGFPWNVITAITIMKNKLYNHPTIMFLLSLTVTDILLLVCLIPVIVITGFHGEYILGSTDEQRCKTCLLGIIPTILFLNSLFTVMLMSMDRFVYIYQPFLYERKATKFSIGLLISGAFISSILLCIPFLTANGLILFSHGAASCNIRSSKLEWPLYVMIVVISSSLVVIVACNICTAYIVQKNIRKVYGGDSVQRDEIVESMKKKGFQKKLHMFHVFGALILSNLITWLPVLILGFLIFIDKRMLVTFGATTFSNIVYNSQVVVHPILETTLISDVREPVKNMITCGLLKKKKHSANGLCSKYEASDHCSCRSLWNLINAALIYQESVNSAVANKEETA